MKVQCERCKEIVLFEFAVGPGGIDVTCGGCGARYHVPETTSAAPTVPLPAGEMLCPKCHEAQPPAPACRRCGLIQAKWQPGPDSRVAEHEGAPAREVTLLWDACVSMWEDPEVHEAFLGSCQRSGAFAFAAARYKRALEQRGGQDPVAERQLRQVRSLAELALLRPTRPTGEPASAGTPYKNAVVVLTVGVALLLAGFVYVVVTHQ